MNSPNLSNNSTSNFFGSIIDVYTRQDALEDRVQVCLSDRFPNKCQLYCYPVYCTAAVFHLIESATANNPCSDQTGIVWDIMWMSTHSLLRSHPNPATCVFTLIIQGADQVPDFWEDESPIYRLKAKCEPKDLEDSTPVITISLPSEDG